MSEEWRAVVGFEGSYEVSNLGRVRSLDRHVTYQKQTGKTRSVTKFYKGRLLRPGTVKSGHQLVVLGLGNIKRSKFVHDLVLRAFVGPPPPETECCHGDGNPANNPLSNLRWGTRLENVADAIKHGTANFWGHRSHA